MENPDPDHSGPLEANFEGPKSLGTLRVWEFGMAHGFGGTMRFSRSLRLRRFCSLGFSLRFMLGNRLLIPCHQRRQRLVWGGFAAANGILPRKVRWTWDDHGLENHQKMIFPTWEKLPMVKHGGGRGGPKWNVDQPLLQAPVHDLRPTHRRRLK